MHERLREWFGLEFQWIDGDTGELLYGPEAESGADWEVRCELCREVAAQGKAALLEDEADYAVLALPIASQDGSSIVAVGTFATTVPAVGATHRGQMALPCSTASWNGQLIAWNPEVLIRMGQLAIDQVNSEARIHALSNEVSELSLHLSTTYEEISLLYRITQNLKLSANDEELGTAALDGLAEVLPVEALAIQLTPNANGVIHDRSRSKPVLLTSGPCPLDCEAFSRLVAYLRLSPSSAPVVINASTTSAPTWPWPEVRQMIIVPLSEGANGFGWLAAFNRVDEGELGSVETNLLNSVGTILGIHSGNAELYQKQREFFAGMVRALTSAIDAKDPYTCGHSDRVARVAVRLAEELGCNRKQLDTIYLAGLLHDVGKIGIDDNVLRKPGKLTEAEYEHIKTHTEIGHRILCGIKQLDDVLPVVLHHHEQWDGKGYPHQLVAESIPFLARIVAVADSFDAMGSDRPYRKGMDDEKLDAIMRAGAGSQWDANVVEAFFRARDSIRQIAQHKVEKITFDAAAWV